ncbi:MAG: hypothetical protein U1A27_10555 [Phycisphaerae bacterium]
MSVEETCICSSCLRDLPDASAARCEHCDATFDGSRVRVPLRCVACGYCLTGVVDPHCPECGTRIDREQIAEKYRKRVTPPDGLEFIGRLVAFPLLAIGAIGIVPMFDVFAAAVVALVLLCVSFFGGLRTCATLSKQIMLDRLPQPVPVDGASFPRTVRGVLLFLVLVAAELGIFVLLVGAVMGAVAMCRLTRC